MQKGVGVIYILVGVLILAALVGGYLIYQNQPKPTPLQPITQPSPTPDETANWKTYTKYGISFKYPENYIIKDSGVGTISIGSSEGKFNNSLSQVINVDAKLSDIHASYNEATKVLLEQFKDIGKYHITKGDNKVRINWGPYSVPTAKLENVYAGIVYWEYKGGAVTAQYNNVSKDEAAIYDQILSTFRFD